MKLPPRLHMNRLAAIIAALGLSIVVVGLVLEPTQPVADDTSTLPTTTTRDPRCNNRASNPECTPDSSNSATSTSSVTSSSLSATNTAAATTSPFPAPTGERFVILLSIDGMQLWSPPYYRNLPNGGGWIDGDRSGYRCTYMFQSDPVDEDVMISSVTFIRSAGASYTTIRDKGMSDKIERYLDGTPVPPGSPGEMGDCPKASGEYEPYTGPDVRPLIYVVKDGVVLENRSYTNTTGEAIEAGRLKFEEVDRITTPFQVKSPLGRTYTVYERVIVRAHFDVENDGVFLPAVDIYYDALVPGVTFAETSDP